MKNVYRLLFAVILLGIIAGCGQDDDGSAEVEDNEELIPITFSLEWTPNTNHTGIYVAKEQGYFEDQGLDVEIILPGEAGADQLIASGKADFGISVQENVTEARAEGLPIVSIASVVQHNTAAYASLADKDMTEPSDFEGKQFGAYGSDIERAMLKTIMDNNDADINDVDFITTGDSDFFVAVERDVDFSLVYMGWTGIEAELRDVDLNMVYLADFANELNFYSPLIATNEAMIEEDPELVEDFLHAAVQGYEFAIENPEDAATILIDSEPDLDPELVMKSQEWLSPKYQDDADQFGFQEKSRWEDFSDFMVENGIMDEGLDVEKAFTNEFLPSKE